MHIDIEFHKILTGMAADKLSVIKKGHHGMHINSL